MLYQHRFSSLSSSWTFSLSLSHRSHLHKELGPHPGGTEVLLKGLTWDGMGYNCDGNSEQSLWWLCAERISDRPDRERQTSSGGWGNDFSKRQWNAEPGCWCQQRLVDSTGTEERGCGYCTVAESTGSGFEPWPCHPWTLTLPSLFYVTLSKQLGLLRPLCSSLHVKKNKDCDQPHRVEPKLSLLLHIMHSGWCLTLRKHSTKCCLSF